MLQFFSHKLLVDDKKDDYGQKQQWKFIFIRIYAF